jgi:hypothetical protein
MLNTFPTISWLFPGAVFAMVLPLPVLVPVQLPGPLQRLIEGRLGQEMLAYIVVPLANVFATYSYPYSSSYSSPTPP